MAQFLQFLWKPSMPNNPFFTAQAPNPKLPIPSVQRKLFRMNATEIISDDFGSPLCSSLAKLILHPIGSVCYRAGRTFAVPRWFVDKVQIDPACPKIDSGLITSDRKGRPCRVANRCGSHGQLSLTVPTIPSVRNGLLERCDDYESTSPIDLARERFWFQVTFRLAAI
ncbi:MAG: hypothetical protein DWI22_21480 [Planctomycetota bacterium]|nr:MAG: hypothetical protein DWI22_21480 [Planctomycetota bacterium]